MEPRMTVSASISPVHTIRLIATDIKLAHSVFAMPFALLAAFMATIEPPFGARHLDWGRFGKQLGLIILAMFFARTCAMIANRLIDQHVDKANPRTVNRALPSGRVSATAMAGGIVLAALLLLLVCTAFGALFDNWWPLILGPFVLLWISAYGVFKRFTSLCHIYLGSSLALSPIAAAIAINPQLLLDQPAIWLLSGMVLCWVAGFDIIYALQDVDVDRRDGLFSMPARFGVQRAMWISRILHATALACLFAALVIDERLHILFAIGILIVAALLLYEHLTVARWGTTKIALAFFTLNGVISCVLGALGIADVLM
jgi:4-hydroxybenzoate polyprenyltransferase